MRYSLVKVLLPMSPSRPSFPMRLHPFPRSPRAVSPSCPERSFLLRSKPRGTPIISVSPLSTAFTPNRPLTPLSTAFTQNDRGGVSRPSDIPALRLAAVVLLPANPLLSDCCALFFSLCAFFAHALFVFNRLRPLFAKHPGGGTPDVLTSPPYRLPSILVTALLSRNSFHFHKHPHRPGVLGTAKPIPYLGNPP